MATAIPTNLHTVRDAAARLGVSESRIRQLCRQHDIGIVVGNTRIFSDSDLSKLESVPRVMGRPKNQENSAENS